MKPGRSSTLLMTVILGCAPAISSGTRGSPALSTPAALMQADRDFAVATHARGIEGWMSFYARDAIRIKYRGDMVKGLAAIRAYDEPGISDTASVLNWEPTDAHVFRDGTIGSTTGRFSVISRKTADAGKELARGRYVSMWRLENGRWLVIVDTGYPEPPTPAR
jgi:ketosteroid isomerase-like protein